MPTTAGSAGGSPAAHHRRHLSEAANASEKFPDHAQSSFSSDFCDSEYSNTNSGSKCVVGGGGGGHHHPAFRYLLVRKRVPEKFVYRGEEFVANVLTIMQSFRSRKNTGRSVLGLLLALVVVSVFLKFSFFINGNVGEVNESLTRLTDNGQLVLQNFKNDWANAHQKIVSESESSSSSSGDVVLKRQMKEVFVSFFILIKYRNLILKNTSFRFSCDGNRNPCCFCHFFRQKNTFYIRLLCYFQILFISPTIFVQKTVILFFPSAANICVLCSFLTHP